MPADARLLAGDPIEVDQSALTGKSSPVTRGPGEAVFSGSIVRQGETDAFVYATGTKTYFGQTAALVEQAHAVSHFQKAVLEIGNYLIVLAVILVAVIVASGLLRHDPMLETFEFALVLLVAAIPVAMPTVLSVTMAVGARLLSKKQAIVTRLSSIEELAGVDILCSDKTGTLTENKLTLGDPFTLGGPAAKLILYAALASRAEDKDTIDLTVIAGVTGSTRVLAAMAREYTREWYLERIAWIKAARREISMTSDIIVGFPGETEAELEETATLLEEVKYDAVFCFKYSSRPNTPATGMADSISEEEKSRRLQVILDRQREVQRKGYARHLGQVMEVMVEGHNSARGQVVGRSSQNKTVNFTVKQPILPAVGSYPMVRITETFPNSLVGEAVQG